MLWQNRKYYGYYKKNYTEILRLIIFLSVLVILYICGSMVDIQTRKVYITLIWISIITYIYDIYYRIYKKNKKDFIMLDTSKKAIKKFKYLIFLAYIVVLSMFFINIVYKINYNLFAMMFIFTIGPATIYFQLMTVGFFDEYYYSGEYKIFYKEIDRLKILKEVSSTDGLVVYFELKKGNEVIGYDKMMLDNFLLLKSKIEENNKKI